MTWRVRVTFDPPFIEFRRGWNRARLRGLKAAGQLWIDKFLPRHFTKKWASRYQYAERNKDKPGFYAKFAKRFPGRTPPSRKPLIGDGKSKTMIMDTARARARGAKGNVIMTAPWYIKEMHNMDRELTTVLPDEEQQMTATALDGIITSWSRIRRKRKVEAGAR